MVDKVTSNISNPGLWQDSNLLSQIKVGTNGTNGTNSTAVKPGSTTLMAQAQRPKADTAVDTASKIFSIVMPDALVYTNRAMRSGANSKNFALLNPMSGNFTHYINHPANRGSLFGLPATRVEAIIYNTNGTGTRREDGMGYTQKFGAGSTQSTFFINGRVGDTNLNNAANGGSVNVGFFGPPSVIQAWTDTLPSSGKGGQLKKVLQAFLQTASATGSEVGVAWRAWLQMNSKTGKLDLTLSGVTIPLADFTDGLEKAQKTVALNYGDKPVARINNEEAYAAGANPFQRADDTRAKDGRYINHTDPVASIAGDILELQEKIQGTSVPKLRNNSQAKSIIESAIGLAKQLTPEEARKYKQYEGIQDVTVNPRALTAAERTKLHNLLVRMDRAGVYFDSPTIKEAAQAAGKTAGPAKNADKAEQTFTRHVFQGKFRSEAEHQYNVGDGVRDILLGLNRVTAIVTSLFEASRTANGELPKNAIAARVAGFEARMMLKGGTLSALGLREPAGTTRKMYEAHATRILIGELEQRLGKQRKEATSEALYQAFNQLTGTEKRAIAKRIEAQLRKP